MLFNGQGGFRNFIENEVCINNRFPWTGSTFPAPLACQYGYFPSESMTRKWPKPKWLFSENISFNGQGRFLALSCARTIESAQDEAPRTSRKDQN